MRVLYHKTMFLFMLLVSGQALTRLGLTLNLGLEHEEIR